MHSFPSNSWSFTLSPGILPRLRARDEEAYKELVEKGFTPLARYAYSFVRSFDVAKDIAQDVLVWVWYQGEGLDPKGSLEAYLYGAVRHKALNMLREDATRARYAESVIAETEEEGSGYSSDETGSSPGQPLSSLEDMLAILTEKQRTAVTLRYGQELKLEEVAAVLGISVKNTRVLLERAINRMKSSFNPSHD